MKKKSKKSIQKPFRSPPIVFIPDKSYVAATGNVIPQDVIFVTDLVMYERMKAVLAAWGKEEIGVPGKRGAIEG